jgi:hypothetical protein
VALVQPDSSPRIVQANRRAGPRLRADDLPWLERARLRNGSPVSLIDLSLGGAFFEVGARLLPGDLTEFEFVGDEGRAVTAGRILRSEVVQIRSDGVLYRGACAFDDPLPWTRRLALPPAADREPVIQADDRFQPWWGTSETRLIFRHGRRLAGFTRGFQGSEAFVDLWASRTASAGEKQSVPLPLLRAVYVVRDFDDAGPVAPDRSAAKALQQVDVVFRNNERLSGGIPRFQRDDIGFWVLPVDEADAVRVFAVSSAVAEIRVF